MYSLVKIELTKIFKKWRSYLGYIGITFVVAMIQINLYIYGSREIKYLTRGFDDLFIMSGNLLNGYFIGYLILHAFFILFPLTIVLVAGEIIAGEATSGTFRLILIRPISRIKILLAKFISGSIYIVTILLWMILLTLVISHIIFGSGELIVISDSINIFAQDDILWRFAFAYLHVFFSMSLVFSLAFLFSSLVENAIGPIISTMVILIFFVIISQLPLDLAQNLKPFLFTNYFMDWNLFFSYEIDWITQIKSTAFIALHTLLFLILSIIIFIRKDILT